MKKDLHSNILAERAISPAAAIGSSTTTTSQIIDRLGYDSLEFLIISGALTDGTYTPSLFESDDSGMSGETEVTAAASLLGTAALATFALTNDDVVKKIGYRGNKRYVRLKIVSTVVTTGGFLCAVAIKSNPRSVPAGGIA